jgi:two-component system, chemotaxis family, CheB/CheR fusion protein
VSFVTGPVAVWITIGTKGSQKGQMALKKKRPAPGPKRPAASQPGPFPIVGIGASAGGFEAFAEMLNALPADPGMAFVLIQHLDPTHESMLANLLARKSVLPVSQVVNGMVVKPNHVYVTPPNKQMGIHDGSLDLVKRAPTGERNMPIDHFFQSLAAYRKEGAIGVILSGTASDGTFGLKAIKAEGGICFAQNEGSAKYFGMPASAIAAGCVDFVLPPREIAAELVRIGRDSLWNPLLGTQPAGLPQSADGDIRKVLLLIRNLTGMDFSNYKTSTIHRRIVRRMLLKKIESVHDYVELLRHDGAELAALHEDLLIHVTSFFREPETFDNLKTQMLPKLFEGKTEAKPLRVWVPGCSTGEEAYSIAIALVEYLGQKVRNAPVQIFATDVSEPSIEYARAGVYSGATLAEVSPERLAQFFVRFDGGYRVSQYIRDLCTFARQDVIQDPPFSRIDLISCRNVLIYLEPVLQKRVLAAFHYALNSNGVLLLGKSETLNAFSDLFTAVQKRSKFYCRKAITGSAQFRAAVGYERPEQRKAVKPSKQPVDLQKEADRIVWNRYAHAGIIVDENLQILHFRGDTSPYMAPAAGAASLHLLKMVRGSLLVDLRAAFREAKKENARAKRAGIILGSGGHSREVSLEVLPLSALDAADRQFLILFEESRQPAAAHNSEEAAAAPTADVSVVSKLEQELLATREYLQAIIEEQETTNEELKAANEEVLSNNEELQSTNEELETAKEELQSTNEELVTLSEQQASRNTELNLVNDDLRNVLEGIKIPILMLDNERRIRRFTPSAEKLFNLLPSDIGRPIQNLRPNLDLADLHPLISRTMDTLTIQGEEVRDLKGRYYSMTVRPYRTSHNKVDGVLIALADIDALKRSLEEANQARDYASSIVETARESLVVLDSSLRVLTANRAFYELFQVAAGAVASRSILDLAGDASTAELRKLLEETLTEKNAMNDFRLEHEFPSRGTRVLLLNGRRLQWERQGGGMILLAMEDVTDKEHSAKALEQSRERLRDLATGLLTAQEEEHRRISRELHDDLNQRLAMLTVELETLEKDSLLSLDFRSRLASLRSKIEDISDDVRRTAHQLHPSLVEHLGLAAALRSLCIDFSKQLKLRINCRQPNIQSPIAPEIALCLYRVAQEALRNVAQHSGAKSATVSLASARNQIRLTVSDKGAGFDRNGSNTKRGLGILSMEERVRSVGGKISIDSSPGRGTRLVVEVPLMKDRS